MPRLSTVFESEMMANAWANVARHIAQQGCAFVAQLVANELPKDGRTGWPGEARLRVLSRPTEATEVGGKKAGESSPETPTRISRLDSVVCQ